MCKRNGWAIECRINAEDPFRNFLPSTGRLVRFAAASADHVPVRTGHLLGVRVDTGVQDGGEIPMYYDSMIAKLIVHGTDRNDAIAKMREALNGFVIRGISSNIPFQAALLAHPSLSAATSTPASSPNTTPRASGRGCAARRPNFLVALAAFVRRKSRERAAGMSAANLPATA
jgi:propionyl-CoA carboxylase alpha chain